MTAFSDESLRIFMESEFRKTNEIGCSARVTNTMRKGIIVVGGISCGIAILWTAALGIRQGSEWKIGYLTHPEGAGRGKISTTTAMVYRIGSYWGLATKRRQRI